MRIYENLKILLVMALLGNSAFAGGQLFPIPEEGAVCGAQTALYDEGLGAGGAMAAALDAGYGRLNDRSKLRLGSGALSTAAFGGGFGVAAPTPAATYPFPVPVRAGAAAPTVGYGASAAASGGGYGVSAAAPVAAADPILAPVRGVVISREDIVGTDLTKLVRGITLRADGALENVPDPRITEVARRYTADECFILGLACREGPEGRWGVVKDDVKAFLWFQRASLGHHTEALFYLGLAYFEERGIEGRDIKGVDASGNSIIVPEHRLLGARKIDAFRSFEMAAEQGHVKAPFYKGLCYEKGYGVIANPEEAFRIIQEAASKGDAEAQGIAGLLAYNLGARSFNGNAEGSRDYPKAIAWFEKAKEYGLDVTRAREKVRDAQFQSMMGAISTGEIDLLPLA